MKKIILYCFISFAFFAWWPCIAQINNQVVVLENDASIPAFSGAEGFGRYSKGGRGGSVYYVENLNDSGPGSLRFAIEDTVPRTIHFRVSGTIVLQSELVIKHPFLTIAGQTAPGDGICLKNYPLTIRNTHDIIIRNIRIRPGIESGLEGGQIDAIGIYNSRKVIVDHCSFSWSNDEVINTVRGNKDITIQWCIFAEPLNRSVHRGPHGYAASIGGERASYHHNLFVHAAGRNPSIGGDSIYQTKLLDFSNNVIFNWQHRSCDGKPVSINVTGNYYKPGPATNSNVRRRIVKIDDTQVFGFSSRWYIHGNIIEGFPDLSDDNWKGAVDFDAGTSKRKNKATAPFDNGDYFVRPATHAYYDVLKYAGARFPRRDIVDERIVAEVMSGKPTFGDGIIDRVEQVGGWPELKTDQAPLDSDNDGMPDDWEVSQGLDPLNPEDRNHIVPGEVYTNLERYLNELTPLN